MIKNKKQIELLSWATVTIGSLLVILLINNVKNKGFEITFTQNSEMIFVYISSIASLMIWRHSEEIYNPYATIISPTVCILEGILYAATIFGPQSIALVIWSIFGGILYMVSVALELKAIFTKEIPPSVSNDGDFDGNSQFDLGYKTRKA